MSLLLQCFLLMLFTSVRGEELYEGDLLLTSHDYSNLKGLARAFAPRKPWPKATIPYRFDSRIDASSKAKYEIVNAMNEWMSKTCIKFVPWKSSDKAYITFVKDDHDRCASYGVGYYGFPYKVVLAERCWYQGMIVHELGHVIGFLHEQNRPDRDNYVTINWKNIKDGREFDFQKDSGDPVTYATPYDHGSIMHYGAGFASKNGEDTIVSKVPGVTMGDWKYLTQRDIMQLQILYKCSGKFKFSKIICEGQRDKLECYGGRKLQLTYANYGRQNMLKCSFFPWTLCKSEQLGKLRPLCDGKSRCDVTVSNSFFGGDPCPGASKYLEVNYKCVP